MVSKNNKSFYLRKSANKVSKYAIKKLSVGVASVLLSTAFFLGSATATNASAAETETKTKTELAASSSGSALDSSDSVTSEAQTVARSAAAQRSSNSVLRAATTDTTTDTTRAHN